MHQSQNVNEERNKTRTITRMLKEKIPFRLAFFVLSVVHHTDNQVRLETMSRVRVGSQPPPSSGEKWKVKNGAPILVYLSCPS